MKTIIIAVFCQVSFVIAAIGQEKLDAGVIEKIKSEEANNSHIATIAYHLTDVCGARLTNSPGYYCAMDWVIKTVKEWGLQNAKREPWGEFGKGWESTTATLEMKSPYYENMIAYPVPWSKGTKGRLKGEVVLIDDLDSSAIDKLGDSIKGKIVMARPKGLTMPLALQPDVTRYPDSNLNSLPDKYMITREVLASYLPYLKKEYYTTLYLEQKGAAALIHSDPKSRSGTVFVGSGAGFKKGYEPTMAQMQITQDDYLKIARLMQDGKVTLEMNLQVKFHENDLTGYNLVAEIPGTDAKLKNEVVMLGGHLDSWAAGTGATDNAAGCIAALEAIRILKALGIKPRRTIRLALWGGEEQGIIGSFAYVKNHFGDPTVMKVKPEQAKISAYYNLDNGSGKIRGIYTQNNMAVIDLFENWLKPFKDMGATGVTTSNSGATDHISFDAVGIPAFQFIQDPLDYETRTHHSNMDTYDHLSIPDLQQAAVVIAGFVYNTAMRDEMLPRKPLPAPHKFVFDFDFPL